MRVLGDSGVFMLLLLIQMSRFGREFHRISAKFFNGAYSIVSFVTKWKMNYFYPSAWFCMTHLP